MRTKSRSKAEWQELLDPETYRVMWAHGTEPPFENEYYRHGEQGTYLCASCKSPLFSSENKYDSGSGWPAFTEPIDEEAVGEEHDGGFGMSRTEVHCKSCGGHLGHVFPDGPRPTGKRYCINSAALKFREVKDND